MYEETIIIIVLAIALAMDAFAVSITLGMSGLAKTLSQRMKIGFTFGAFQGGLFLLGCYLTILIGNHFATINQIIAFIILTILGLKMIKDSFDKVSKKCTL